MQDTTKDTTQHKQKNMMNKYWYKFTCFYCPVCGSEDWIKERQYTPKPEDGNERYVHEIRYDWCDI